VDEVNIQIPENIVVHLGAPDENAGNLTVPFPEYIKNVASTALYPTWPENALRANICAQVTFALNRIRTGWYRSRGYRFDITSTAEHDQEFVRNRNYYANICRLVDTCFHEYIVKKGGREPYDAACDRMPPWGTVTLANEGYLPFQILQYYYGEDIAVESARAPVCGEAYPGYPLKLDSSGRDVESIQRGLNRIGRNYPAIPLIEPVDGFFDTNTERAVMRFQQIFDLPPDGIVGPDTWYRICRVNACVKRLADLYNEGIVLSKIPKQCPGPVYLGQKGKEAILLRFYVNMIAAFYQAIGPVEEAGGYDKTVRDQVAEIQKLAGLTPNGIVDEKTWDAVYSIYAGIMENVPEKYFREAAAKPAGRYPGYNLKETGEAGDE
jgi:peptidoglycan hydrolase-like protein with peptidoglycan-binding domain